MSEFAARKRAEIDSKFASLDAEFLTWLKRADKNNDLPLHHSQVRRLIGDEGEVKRLRDAIHAAWKEGMDTEGTELVSVAAKVEEELLAAYGVWGFFREKLAQRLDLELRPYLDFADELAWMCYEPFCQAAEQKKEPPLVFLNGDVSPFILGRGVRWEMRGVSSNILAREAFASLVKSLPIPVIGVSWTQATHLPEVVFIAHETGHAVEDDFELTAGLENALDEALENAGGDAKSRRDAWRSWLGELWADVFAIAHVGPAFVAALQDFLVPYAAITSGRAYPPHALRLRVGQAAIRALGDKLVGEADDLREGWEQSVGVDSLTPFDGEIEALVKSLLDFKHAGLRNKSLRDLGGFSAERLDEVNAAVDQCLSGKIIEGDDVRVIFAAAHRCHERHPDKAGIKMDRFKAKLKQILRGGTRSAHAARVPPPSVDLGLFAKLQDLSRKASIPWTELNPERPGKPSI